MKMMISLGMAVLLAGCGAKYTFTNASTTLPDCNPTVSTTEDLRILFMVDNSGSTTTTDPSYAVRKGSIDDFLASYGGKSNFSYSFGYFGGTTATDYSASQNKFVTFANSGAIPGGTFFGNSGMLEKALADYLTIGISGNTPYKSAFSAASRLIEEDETASPKKYLYSVIFMSDGQPTDVATSSSPGSASDPMVELANEVVAAASPGQVGISTLYFGPEPVTATDTNAKAIANLQTLASVGNGKFVDSNQTTQIVISDLISVPGNCPN